MALCGTEVELYLELKLLEASYFYEPDNVSYIFTNNIEVICLLVSFICPVGLEKDL